MMGRKRKTNNQLPERVYIKHGAYYFVDKNNKWHRLGKTYSESIIEYSRHLKNTTNITKMRDVFARYIQEIVPKKALRTQKDNIAEIANLTQAFGHMTPADIKPKHVYAYMDARQAPTRANREKSTLQHVLSYAIRWGLLEQNPCREVKKYKEMPRKRLVTDEEFWAIHDMANETIQNTMMIAVSTGLRISDILKLKLSDIKNDLLSVKTAKTGKGLDFEINTELQAIINNCKKYGQPSIFLIKNKKGQSYGYSGFASMWQRTMKKAVKEGRIKNRFPFNDLRAKAGTDSGNEKLLGHLSPDTFNKVYNRKPFKVTPNSIKK